MVRLAAHGTVHRAAALHGDSHDRLGAATRALRRANARMALPVAAGLRDNHVTLDDVTLLEAVAAPRLLREAPAGAARGGHDVAGTRGSCGDEAEKDGQNENGLHCGGSDCVRRQVGRGEEVIEGGPAFIPDGELPPWKILQFIAS